MVGNFRFSRIPQITFSKGKIADLPVIISGYGGKVVIVRGKGSLDSNNSWAGTTVSLAKHGISPVYFQIPSEPSVAMIDGLVTSVRQLSPKVIVAVGGGSVMDAGKAISAMATVEGSVKDYLESVGKLTHPGTKIPFIAVPTTSGTGSEATKNAVISQTGKNGFKRSLRHENFVPDIAIVDPLMSVTCSREITAASGMDCFTQLTEAFLSSSASPYTDALALEGLRMIRDSLLPAYVDGSDIEARTGMSFAALTSGICLANAGLGVIHGFASSIGAHYDIPHGIVCGTLMALSNEVTVRKLRKGNSGNIFLSKYSKLGHLFSQEDGKSDDYYTDWFINYLFRLTDDLNLQGLKQSGMDWNDIEMICSETDCKNNPVKLEKEELIEILTTRFV